MRAACVVLVALAGCGACDDRGASGDPAPRRGGARGGEPASRPGHARTAGASESEGASVPDPRAQESGGAAGVAPRELAPVYDPSLAPPPPQGRLARRVAPAAHEDGDWEGSEPVAARRLVYRVTLRVPGVLGTSPPIFPPAAAELLIDVAVDRLRARFVGPGWPVEAGAEVRLRADFPGAYVFDATGGRAVAPGALAAWFQGGAVSRAQLPAVGVQPAPAAEGGGAGSADLVCALLAELSGQERGGLLRRCARGAPAVFRLGPWRAERTADVPVELPREALRADQADPPTAIPPSESRAFFAPEALARLDPRRGRRASDEPAPADAPGEGLRVVNHDTTRVIVIVHGVPIGWVQPGATGHFVGLREGQHLVAGMRPLGNLGIRPRELLLPAEIQLR